MTTLATQPLCDGQLDLLAQIADTDTPLGSLRTQDFRDACELDGRTHEGWVNPNRVSFLLHAKFGEIKPQWFSAQWAPACGPKGFMDITDVEVPIDPKRSKGNGNKKVKLRRLRKATS